MLPGHASAQRAERFLLLVQARRVPEFHLPVAACRSQVRAVLAEGQPADFPFVGIECADFRPVMSLPYLHGSIDISRDQIAAIGAERHGVIW